MRTRQRTHKTKRRIGSKAEVFHGTAKRTPGGLEKGDLMKNKRGHIVSKKQSAAGHRTNNLGDFIADAVSLGRVLRKH